MEMVLCKVVKALLSFLKEEIAMTFFFAEVGSQHIGDNGEHGGGGGDTRPS